MPTRLQVTDTQELIVKNAGIQIKPRHDKQ